MSHSSHRQGNIDDFKEKAANYDSDSVEVILKGCAKAILNVDIADRAAYLTRQKLGDPELEGCGLQNFLPAPDADEVSDLFKKPGLKMLDFACGTGLLVKLLSPYFPKDSTVIGIDISPDQIAMFDLKLPEIAAINPGATVKPYVYDILDTDWDAQNNLAKPAELQYESFDIITVTLAFHHLANLDTFIAEFHHYLKKGGKFIIVDLYNPDVRALHKKADDDSAVTHHGGLSPDELNAMLSPSFAKVETGDKYLAQQWCNSGILKNWMGNKNTDPHDEHGHGHGHDGHSLLDGVPTRQKLGQTEWLISMPMIVAVCTK